MSSSKSGAAAIDAARAEICRRFARLMNAGSVHLRVRLPLAAGKPTEAWFYAHRDNAWHKESDVVQDAALVAAIDEAVAMVAKKAHADEWAARKHATHDWKEVNIEFHRDAVSGHLGAKLESYVMGLLFHNGHDSKQDRRQQLRQGPITQGRTHP
jgi:hypothetical protein